MKFQIVKRSTVSRLGVFGGVSALVRSLQSFEVMILTIIPHPSFISKNLANLNPRKYDV